MNKETFIKELNNIGINPSTEQLTQLDEYADFLLKYNTKTNLTAIREKEQVYLKHFYDSLTIVKTIDLNNINTIIDIGTGPGFPGVVLKIMYPNIELTLLDSNNKKIEFLKQLVDKLKLINIQIINGRAEEFINNNREKYDIVTSRAVSNLPVLTELCMPFVRENGYFIAMKGQAETEIKDSMYAIKELGGEIENINKFYLPIENSERNIIKIKKIHKTDSKYPRRYDKITKNPLKKNQK